MKRFFFVLGAAAILTAPVFAQLGTAPAGFAAHVSETAQLGFFYPEDWTVVDNDQTLAIVSRAGLADQINNETPDLQPGDTVLVVGVLPLMLLSMMGVPADDLETMVDGMFTSMMESSGDLENSETLMFSHGGRDVAAVSFDDAAQEISGLMMIAHQQDDVIAFAAAMGMREDIDRNGDRLSRVVSTVEFTGDLSALMGQ